MPRTILKILAIAAALIAAHAANISIVVDSDIIQGQPATIKGIAENVGNSTLSWVVGTDYIANVTIVVSNGTATITKQNITFDNSYAASFASDGLTVTTNLTLTAPDFSSNGAAVKLTDGKNESIHTLKINVTCKTPPDNTTELCSFLGCLALINVTDTTETYCTQAYVCTSGGEWIANGACLQFCAESGKRGENCTENCGSGCGGRCFANGSCADSTYLNVAECAAGYTGQLCDQMATPDTTSSTAVASATDATQSATGATVLEKTTTFADRSQSTPGATTPPVQECDAKPALSCLKEGNIAAVVSNCSDDAVKSICTRPWRCERNRTWNVSGKASCDISCVNLENWGPKCTKTCSPGCRVGNNTYVRCDMTSGRCIDPATSEFKAGCADGYEGEICERELCKEDCNTNLCQNWKFCGGCSRNYAMGKTCYKGTCETWGLNCTQGCSPGCRVGNNTIYCNQDDGKCIDPTTGKYRDGCAEGYEGDLCEKPICGDCNGGTCLAPEYCGNCPKHYDKGKTCRNIRLDGFTKGSIPAMVILGAVIALLAYGSKWYIRNKIKEE